MESELMLGALIVENKSLGLLRPNILETVLIPQIEAKLLCHPSDYPFLAESADLLSPSYYDRRAALGLLSEMKKASSATGNDILLASEIALFISFINRFLEKSDSNTLVLTPFVDATYGNL
jgi:hypothetical protein